MDLPEIIRSRHSVKQYDRNAPIDDESLKQLFNLVTLSPSSWNLQHWRFVVVRDPAQKQKVSDAAYGQPHVNQSSAVIVVVGQLNAYEDAGVIWSDTADHVRDGVVSMSAAKYGADPVVKRDEAVRSASLAAMTLMLVAKDMGLGTCPMIGFDTDVVSKIVGLDENQIPVMLITIGTQDGDPRNRGHRWPLEHVVKFNRIDGPGLR